MFLEEYPIMDSIQTSLASLSLQGMVLDECEAPRNRRAEVMPSSPLSQKSGGRGGSVPRPGSAMPPSSARSSSAPRGPPVEVQKKMSAAPVKIDIQKSASRTASASMPTASTTPTPSASTTTATITTTTQQPQNNIPNNTSASKHKVPTLSISSANENNQDMQRDDNGELIPVETIDYTLVPTQLV